MNYVMFVCRTFFLIPLLASCYQAIEEKLKIFEEVQQIIETIKKSTQRSPSYLNAEAHIIHNKISEIGGVCKTEKINAAGEMVLIGTGIGIGLVATILTQKMAPLVVPTVQIFYTWFQAMLASKR